MFVKNFFAFSFGGKNDFGRVVETIVDEKLDFSSKPVGIGYAIRNGIDADLSNKKNVSICLETDSDIDEVTLEFKTQNSGGAPEVSKNYNLKRGVVTIASPIPENLSSPLREIVIFFPRNGKTDDIHISFGGVCLF